MSLVCVDELKLLRDIEKLLGTQIEKVYLPGYDVDPAIKAEPIVNGRGGARNNSGGKGNNRAGSRGNSRGAGSGGAKPGGFGGRSDRARAHSGGGNRRAS